MYKTEFKPGDRFVIEIAGVMKEVGGERCKQLTDDTVAPRFTAYRIKGFNTLVFDAVGLSRLKPYCEAVRESNMQAYENGVKAGCEKRMAEQKKQTPEVRPNDLLCSTLSCNPRPVVLVTAVVDDTWHVVQMDGMVATIRGDQKRFWKKTDMTVDLIPVLKTTAEQVIGKEKVKADE